MRCRPRFVAEPHELEDVSWHPHARRPTQELITAARGVLDGMLRERSGGTPDAVLHTEVNVGIGTS